MLRQETKILFKSIVNVCLGRYLWKKFIYKNNIDLNFDFVFLLPKGDPQVSYYVLLYLNKFIEFLERRKTYIATLGHPIIRRNEKIFIITNDDDVKKSAKEICRRVTEVSFMSVTDIEKIIQYYCIFPFTDRLIIGALKGIPGRNDYSALVANGITVEELVANCIFDFKIQKFDSKSRPKLPNIKCKSIQTKQFILLNDLRLNNVKCKR